MRFDRERVLDELARHIYEATPARAEREERMSKMLVLTQGLVNEGWLWTINRADQTELVVPVGATGTEGKPRFESDETIFLKRLPWDRSDNAVEGQDLTVEIIVAGWEKMYDHDFRVEEARLTLDKGEAGAEDLAVCVEGKWSDVDDESDQGLLQNTIGELLSLLRAGAKTGLDGEPWLNSVEDLGEWLIKEDQTTSNGDRSMEAARTGMTIWDAMAMDYEVWTKLFADHIRCVKIVRDENEDSWIFEVEFKFGFTPRSRRRVKRLLAGASVPMTLKDDNRIWCYPDGG